MTNQPKDPKPSDSQDSPAIEVIEYPEGSRFIGPADAIVISAAVLRANYLPKTEVEAAIGENEADPLPNTTSRSIFIAAQNDLRNGLRTKLGLHTKKEGE